jgi:hypothetical protein
MNSADYQFHSALIFFTSIQHQPRYTEYLLTSHFSLPGLHRQAEDGQGPQEDPRPPCQGPRGGHRKGQGEVHRGDCCSHGDRVNCPLPWSKYMSITRNTTPGLLVQNMLIGIFKIVLVDLLGAPNKLKMKGFLADALAHQISWKLWLLCRLALPETAVADQHDAGAAS